MRVDERRFLNVEVKREMRKVKGWKTVLVALAVLVADLVVEDLAGTVSPSMIALAMLVLRVVTTGPVFGLPGVTDQEMEDAREWVDSLKKRNGGRGQAPEWPGDDGRDE